MRDSTFKAGSMIIGPALLLICVACSEKESRTSLGEKTETKINATLPANKSGASVSSENMDIVKIAMERGDLQNLECRLVSNQGEQSVQFLDIRENTSVASLLYDPKIFESTDKPTSSTIQLYMNRFKKVVQRRETQNSWNLISGSDLLINVLERNKGTPNYDVDSSYELRTFRKALERRDFETYCIDAVADGSGDPSCIQGLNVKTMEYFNMAATRINKPNGRGAVRFEISYEPELSGPCRKQAEVALR